MARWIFWSESLLLSLLRINDLLEGPDEKGTPILYYINRFRRTQLFLLCIRQDLIYVSGIALLATWEGFTGKWLVTLHGTLEVAGQRVVSGGPEPRCTVWSQAAEMTAGERVAFFSWGLSEARPIYVVLLRAQRQGQHFLLHLGTLSSAMLRLRVVIFSKRGSIKTWIIVSQLPAQQYFLCLFLSIYVLIMVSEAKDTASVASSVMLWRYMLWDLVSLNVSKVHSFIYKISHKQVTPTGTANT